MIEIKDSKGRPVHLDKEDIKEVIKHFDVKKHSIRCKIVFNNGKWMYSCQSLDELTKILKPIG